MLDARGSAGTAGLRTSKAKTKPVFRTTLKTGFGKKQEGNFSTAIKMPRKELAKYKIYCVISVCYINS